VTPAERALRGRLDAHRRWARTPDRAAATKPARDAFLARFEQQVDPHSEHPPEVRRAMARSAMRAHMTDLAIRSAEARKKTA
jgi:hypothetical protein